MLELTDKQMQEIAASDATERNSFTLANMAICHLDDEDAVNAVVVKNDNGRWVVAVKPVTQGGREVAKEHGFYIIDEYPESTKLAAVREQMSQLTDFLEHMNAKGIVPGQWVGESLNPVKVDQERLIAEFFSIDMDLVEKERQAMLKAIC